MQTSELLNFFSNEQSNESENEEEVKTYVVTLKKNLNTSSANNESKIDDDIRREKLLELESFEEKRMSNDPIKPVDCMKDISEVYFPEITPSKMNLYLKPTTFSPKWRKINDSFSNQK